MTSQRLTNNEDGSIDILGSRPTPSIFTRTGTGFTLSRAETGVSVYLAGHAVSVSTDV